jgi:hypothetical protein
MQPVQKRHKGTHCAQTVFQFIRYVFHREVRGVSVSSSLPLLTADHNHFLTNSSELIIKNHPLISRNVSNAAEKGPLNKQTNKQTDYIFPNDHVRQPFLVKFCKQRKMLRYSKSVSVYSAVSTSNYKTLDIQKMCQRSQGATL